MPLVLVALGGSVHLRARKAKRKVAAQDFFTGMMTTARRDEEMIEAVTFPAKAPATGYAFREVARRHGDFAIVACAAIADAKAARLTIGGVAERPIARTMRAGDHQAVQKMYVVRVDKGKFNIIGEVPGDQAIGPVTCTRW